MPKGGNMILEFEVDGGRTTPEGKPHWPDNLTLVLSKSDALDLIVQLANQCHAHEEGDVVVQFVGQFTEESE